MYEASHGAGAQAGFSLEQMFFFLYFHFFTLLFLTRQKVALSSAPQNAMSPEFSGKWRAEGLLLHVRFKVKYYYCINTIQNKSIRVIVVTTTRPTTRPTMIQI